MMDAKAVIKAFCERLGIHSEATAEGVFAFAVDAVEFVIYDRSEEGFLALTGDLGLVPAGNAEGLLRLMLEAQHALRETAGATFSIDRERDCFTLCRLVPCVTLDEETLFNEVERFVNHLETWTHIIRSYEGEKAPHEAPLDFYGMMV